MIENQFHLLASRRFLPLFTVQFLGALNDNVFKNALVILITYRLAQALGANGQVLVTAAAGIFILPFFLFSAPAGQLADKLHKTRLVRLVKLVEVVLMGLAAVGFLIGDVWALMGVLFLMGTQSAFFGPVKYGILPDLLREDELIGGNALFEAGTFLAILVGTIVGGLLVLAPGGIEAVAGLVVLVALAGWGASLLVPATRAAAPELRINPNILGETWAIVRHAASRRDVFLAILGISWFWLVGATFLSQFPNFAKDVVGADETVVTLFLTLFSLGIAIGSLLCNKLLGGAISAKYVPVAALGMTAATLDLVLATSNGLAPGQTLLDARAFLADPGHWRIVVDLLLIPLCGGVYIVPLYAIMQTRGPEEHRSRVIAANNILNALFMVAAAVIASAMLAAEFSVPDVFLSLTLGNAVVAVYICGLLPETVIKAVLAFCLRLVFRVRVRGIENHGKAGDRVIVVANHVSFLDGLLLAAFLPGKPMFAIDTRQASLWYVKPLLALIDAFPMDPANPMAAKGLIHKVREGRQCVIFPEGRLTVTGALMKIHEGPGMIADKAGATLLPVRIDGAQYTPFTRLRGKLRTRWFPRIDLTILPPVVFVIPDAVKGRVRRHLAGQKLYDVMSQTMFESCDRDRTLFQALLDARAIHGGATPVLEDIGREPMTYDRLVLGSLVLGRMLERMTSRGEHVAVLLPNSVGAAVTFFALQAVGRVPAMLNFSTGAGPMVQAIETARVATVLTSRRFEEMAKLQDTVAALGTRARIVYLEDIKALVGLPDKLLGLLMRPFAGRLHARHGRTAGDAAVVLFTSGSEGAPKGVVLSHANLLANRHQLAARVDFNAADVVFNALPVFHSFGLTGGLLLPVLSGIRTFLYPSPLHYRIVPALVYDTNATILFGTDTFLTGYARMAHPYDFYSVRYVFAGAERVRDETRRIWAETFGLRILEGYGATETSPVLATNTPMHFKPGTVGRLVDGVEHRLEPVPGIERGGRLVVRGPNVMLGYLKADRPGELQPPINDEYDTGDIVDVDAQGFVTILGRAKRFAKIGGEMVSLTAVEALASDLWPGVAHAVVSLPDPRKGEQLVLVTAHGAATPAALLAHARSRGMAEIGVPKMVRVVEVVPVLGTGKTDYVKVTELAKGGEVILPR